MPIAKAAAETKNLFILCITFFGRRRSAQQDRTCDSLTSSEAFLIAGGVRFVKPGRAGTAGAHKSFAPKEKAARSSRTARSKST
jgi:hypothetical protein